MHDSAERLGSLIRSRVKDAAKAAEIMETVLPYFAIVKSNKLTILPEAQLDREKIREALALATMLTVNDVALFHMERPFEKPAWMTNAVYERDRTSNVWDDLCASTSMDRDESGLARALRSAHSFSRQKLDSAIWHELRHIVDETIGRPLRAIIESYLENVHVHFLFRGFDTRLAHGVQKALFYYLVFSVSDDAPYADRFAPLLEQMRFTLPFGIKNKTDAQDPTVWITLCMA